MSGSAASEDFSTCAADVAVAVCELVCCRSAGVVDFSVPLPPVTQNSAAVNRDANLISCNH